MEFTSEHLQKIVESEQRSKSNTKRIDEIQRKQEDLESLTKSVVLIANEQEHMRTDIRETKEDVKEIKQIVMVTSSQTKEVDEIQKEVQELRDKPGKRWDEVVRVAISGIVGAVVAYLACQVGLK